MKKSVWCFPLSLPVCVFPEILMKNHKGSPEVDGFPYFSSLLVLWCQVVTRTGCLDSVYAYWSDQQINTNATYLVLKKFETMWPQVDLKRREIM